MEIIPVIDVQHGAAVRASGGARAGYQPLITPLAAGSDPLAVALGFAKLFAFPRLYVADLDGIEGRGRNAALPGRLARTLPGVTLWIDDGTPPGEVAARDGGAHRIPVIGTETLRSADDVAALRALARDRYVLSLDFKSDCCAGPPAVLAEAAHWPSRVIVMTLARVGSGGGPDLERLSTVMARAGNRAVYAAGGVRDARDLQALKAAGAAGALVARALHEGTITAGDLQTIAGR